ncbi:MAG: amidohydrolase [Armatimonadetes bacterium]|nr:amidohydrolase [Armatimonadota bacterium]
MTTIDFLPRLRAAVADVLPEIIALRRDLHQHPELSGSEERTAGIVSEMLMRNGIAHETRVGDTWGVVGVIESGQGRGDKTFALRGDMDALPINEERETAYKSQIPGVMHACGHDGHTANLMGAALVLNRLKDDLPPGRIKLVFQPAEETVRGADVLVAAGVVDDVDAILMLHGWPRLAPGVVGVRDGAVMASSDQFLLTINGKGGHGAYPHDTIDPIAVGAQIVSNLQSIVSREISPTTPAVVSVTQFFAGTPAATNVIPGTAKLGATVRALSPALRDELPERIERIIAGICAAHRATYEFSYSYGTPVTVNDTSVMNLVREVGRDVLGAENIVELPEPTMGAEDFAYYAQKIPGGMFRLGTGCEHLLHTPKYDYGDAPLESGILMFAESARRFLEKGV